MGALAPAIFGHFSTVGKKLRELNKNLPVNILSIEKMFFGLGEKVTGNSQ